MARVSKPRPKRSGNPARQSPGASTPPASPTRERVSEVSRQPLVRLSQLPPLAVPTAMLVLMLVGLMAPLYLAVPALVVIAGFVSWLAYLSWPALDGRGRAIRVVLLGAVLVTAVGRISGWL